ncbi:metalloprotease [Shewanella baltica]|uniref:KPN_02809 family neutral zinc metallopeptidase n=1 Tax=Shewanella TaxID=22 RepID=UPI0007B4D9CE|nr:MULTISPECIES: neutral zinc metallopeptidase [Shewanella]KZK67215.1 metalloprotease [Shewanella baltica]MCS6096802.1 metalloprotease [Shewanella baltica]MCS6154623.1 metalloprotease [Shewanella baltica]MCS6227825.1 metalloprotease [Shewanella baltica]MDT3318606.1 neutral zinc metallopeptidase [Shewanella sp. SP1S2-4]
MRWRDTDRSSNIEDRRGQQMASAGVPSALLLRFLPFLLRTKLGRVVLLIGGIYFAFQYFTGGLSLDPSTQANLSQSQSSSTTAVQDENAQFVAAILGTTETVWGQLLKGQYREPKLVLYRNMTSTGCGMGQAQSGPFYCPADSKVYIDLSFLDELKTLGAPGDFAFAYVIAHEVGHHVQNLLGTSTKVRQAQQSGSKVQANQLSVALELQADCYAGIWGHYANQQLNLLEAGDLAEGIAAASAVGDDRLQQMAGRAVQPDAFTHGSSAQRVKWFKTGFDSGNLASCNTFAAK